MSADLNSKLLYIIIIIKKKLRKKVNRLLHIKLTACLLFNYGSFELFVLLYLYVHNKAYYYN